MHTMAFYKYIEGHDAYISFPKRYCVRACVHVAAHVCVCACARVRFVSASTSVSVCESVSASTKLSVCVCVCVCVCVVPVCVRAHEYIYDVKGNIYVLNIKKIISPFSI